MDLGGEVRINAPRERVWTLLNDPETLRASIPGCESLEKNGDQMTARVTTKIGPVKATFNGLVRLVNVVAPESYRIEGEGKGGVAGFASGGADVRLEEEVDGATLLTYKADAKVGGKLAQLGGRLIESTARKLADQFFTAFAARAEAGVAPAGGATIAPSGIAPPTIAPPTIAPLPTEAPMTSHPVSGSFGTPMTAPAGDDRASPYHDEESGIADQAYRDATASPSDAYIIDDVDRGAGVGHGETPEEAARRRNEAADQGGILSHERGDMPVGAAAHMATSGEKRTTDAATSDPRRVGAPRADAAEHGLERAEERLEVEAGRGTFGGPWVWGLLVLAALIVLLFFIN